MTKQLSTQELADFLGITRQGLRKVVENGTLNNKLLEKNYRFVSSEKQGRKVMYTIEEIKIVSQEEMDDYIKKKFPRVRKKEQFIDYSALRLDPDRPTLASEASKMVKVDRKTGYNWDNLFIEKNIMIRCISNDLDNYWCIMDGRIYPATKEEYTNFFQEKRKLIEEMKLKTEFQSLDHKVIKAIVSSQIGAYYFKSKGILLNNLIPETQEFLDKLSSVRENIRKKYNLKDK